MASKRLEKSAWDTVQAARRIDRPSALDFIANITTDFIELHGDRLFADDKAVVGGVALFEGAPVTVIGIQKGADIKENIERNFGSPNPEGYRKALRLMKQAEKFGRPVLTFINTSGAFCGIGAEERGQGEAIARNLLEMSVLRTPVIALVIGEGGSGGALALAVADEVYMLENAVYSILSPEGFASILWKDGARAKEAADMMKLTAGDLLGLGVIEGIIPETDGLYDKVRALLKARLDAIRAKSTDAMLRARYERFRNIGGVRQEEARS